MVFFWLWTSTETYTIDSPGSQSFRQDVLKLLSLHNHVSQYILNKYICVHTCMYVHMCVYVHTYMTHIWNMTGGPKMEFVYKKLCIYSYMFKLQSSSKHSPFDIIYLTRRFFYCWKQFLNSSILMPFSASAIFYFTSSTLAKHFRLRTFFIGETKMVTQGEIRVNRKDGPLGSCHFWSKTVEHSAWCGQVHL